MEKKITTSFFEIGYILYFLSFFLEDVQMSFGTGVTIIRYASYFCFVIHLINLSISLKRFILMVGIVLVGLYVGLLTSDFYWVIIPVIITSIGNVNVEKIIKISYFLLLLSTLLVIGLMLLGVIENVTTQRAEDESIRYSLGFYHSNVFPMIVFYLMVYRIILVSNKGKMRFLELAFWGVLQLLANYICDSRNGLYGTIICIVLYICVLKIKLEGVWHRGVVFSARWSMAVLATVSLVVSYFQGKGNSLLYKINEFFTGRFAIAYHQMRVTGLRLINLSARDLFRALDNGYLFIALRYGIIFCLFYVVVSYIIANKYRGNISVLVVTIAIACVNFVDNDLCSYGYLFMIVLAFSNVKLQGETNNVYICENNNLFAR